MRNNETKNEADELKNGKSKLNEKIENIKQINICMIFNKIKR